MRNVALTVLFLVQAVTLSAQYEDETLRLLTPDGFEGPSVQVPAIGIKTVAFVKPLSNSERGTLLQITTIDTDLSELSLPDSAQASATDSCVSQFLSGVQRRRDRFEVVSRTEITLSGNPAARAQWRGFAGDHEMTGVMYCVILGSRIVSLHAQSFQDAPADDLPAAIKAIESVILRQ